MSFSLLVLPALSRLRPLFLLLFVIVGVTGCSSVERQPRVETPRVIRDQPREEVVQLQIFLDGERFGPGVVDGRPGEFTAKALDLYRQARDLPADWEPDLSNLAAFTTYTVGQGDFAALGTMASEPVEIAMQKRLPYTRLSELIGERFHTTEAYLRQLNPGVNFASLSVDDVVKVPNVKRPFYADRFPSQYRRQPPSRGVRRSVLINANTRILEVRDEGRLIAALPITPGSVEHPAPAGEWKVVRAVPWPWYRYDEGVLKRGERTTDFHQFPPGTNSPVGILWAGLNRPGIGIHGTSTPETIGRSGSHGCIRLSNWDAATFYTLVQTGMKVTIR